MNRLHKFFSLAAPIVTTIAFPLLVVGFFSSAKQTKLLKEQIRNLNTHTSLLKDQISTLGEQTKLLNEQVDIANFIANFRLVELCKFKNVYGGNRYSYLSLVKMEEDTNDENLKAILRGQISVVKNLYKRPSTKNYVKNLFAVCVPGPIMCEKIENENNWSSVRNIIEHVDIKKYPEWESRARAAYLLRNIERNKDKMKKEGYVRKDILNALVKAMDKNNEYSLLVSATALETYRHLTNFRPVDVLDFEGAIKHWKELKEKR